MSMFDRARENRSSRLPWTRAAAGAEKRARMYVATRRLQPGCTDPGPEGDTLRLAERPPPTFAVCGGRRGQAPPAIAPAGARGTLLHAKRAPSRRDRHADQL